MKTPNLLFISFSLLIALQSCTKKETAIEDAKLEIDNLTSSEYLYFVSGKINGEAFVYGQKNDDTTLNFQLITHGPLADALCAYSREDGTDAKVSYGTTIYPNYDDEDTQPSFGFYFDRFYRCSEPEDFNTLFPIDSYDYSADDLSTGTMKQIGIGYSPTVSGDTYYNSYVEDQSSGSFKITATEAFNSAFGYSQLVEGEFSVTLYGNGGASDIIEITEGKFKLSVSK